MQTDYSFIDACFRYALLRIKFVPSSSCTTYGRGHLLGWKRW